MVKSKILAIIGIILSIFIVGGGIAYKMLSSPTSKDDLYKYLPANTSTFIQITPKDEIFDLITDMAKADTTISNKNIKKAFEYIERFRRLNKYTDRILIADVSGTSHGFDFAKSPSAQPAAFIHTKGSDRVIESFLKKEKNMREIGKKLYLIESENNEKFYLKVDQGNIFISPDKAVVEKIVSNYQKELQPLLKNRVEKIKKYSDKTFVFLGLDTTKNEDEGGIIYGDIDKKNVNLGAEFYPPKDINKEISNAFSGIANDKMDGNRQLNENTLYLRVTDDKDLKDVSTFIPSIVINQPKERDHGNIKTKFKENQFLFFNFKVDNNIYAEVKGFYENNIITLDMLFPRDFLLAIVDPVKEKEIETALDQKLGGAGSGLGSSLLNGFGGSSPATDPAIDTYNTDSSTDANAEAIPDSTYDEATAPADGGLPPEDDGGLPGDDIDDTNI